MKLYFLLILLVVSDAVSAHKHLVTCPGLEPARICTDNNKGFQYNDGCNSITCDGAGTGPSTMIFCPDPSTPDDRAHCAHLKKKIHAHHTQVHQNNVHHKSSNRPLVTCSSLAAVKICTDSNKGFQYNDGCNGVTCDGVGTGVSTMMFCPGPDNDVEEQYCADLQDKVESHFSSTVSALDVTVTP